MKNIVTIFLKEIKRFFTDRRMLAALFLPGIIIFIFYSFMGKIVSSNVINKPTSNVTYKIAYSDNYHQDSEELPLIIQSFNAYLISDDYLNNTNNKAQYYPFSTSNLEEFKEKALAGDFDLLIVFSNDFEYNLENNLNPKKNTINFYYNGSSEISSNVYNIFTSLVSATYNNYLVNFDLETNTEINSNLSNEQALFKTIIAFVFPMVTISLLFSTVMTICPETIAGEKERGTLASLLLTPCRRSEIIVGKISALSVTAFLSGIVSFIALVGSLPQLIGGEFNFDAPTIVALFFLITSALILFVTIGLGVSTLASTVKEANSYISPFMIVSMVLSLLPSFMDMSSIGYSFIPIMNICISMSSIIKGNFDLINIAITIIVNLIVTGLLVVLCAKLFNNERVIFSK